MISSFRKLQNKHHGPPRHSSSKMNRDLMIRCPVAAARGSAALCTRPRACRAFTACRGRRAAVVVRASNIHDDRPPGAMLPNEMDENDPRRILRVSPGTSFLGLLAAKRSAMDDAKGNTEQLAKVQNAFERLISSARQRFETALQSGPESVDAHYQYANFNQTVEDFDRAEQLYRRVLELDAAHVDSLNNLALLLTEQRGQVGEAEGLYKRALALNEKDIDTMFNYATLLRSRGDKAGVGSLLDGILKLRPDMAENELIIDLVDFMKP